MTPQEKELKQDEAFEKMANAYRQAEREKYAPARLESGNRKERRREASLMRSAAFQMLRKGSSY